MCFCVCLAGFPREIPNFPRYSMTGDADRGVHNLRIEHVTLSDIAEYQCQVGPARTNKAIRADAKLNVIGKPLAFGSVTLVELFVETKLWLAG